MYTCQASQHFKSSAKPVFCQRRLSRSREHTHAGTSDADDAVVTRTMSSNTSGSKCSPNILGTFSGSRHCTSMAMVRQPTGVDLGWFEDVP